MASGLQAVLAGTCFYSLWMQIQSSGVFEFLFHSVGGCLVVAGLYHFLSFGVKALVDAEFHLGKANPPSQQPLTPQGTPNSSLNGLSGHIWSAWQQIFFFKITSIAQALNAEQPRC